jgi:hypothetical protein
MEVSGQLHAPTALSQGKCPWYSVDRRLGGPQNRSGRGGEEKKFPSPRRESNTRTPIIQLVVQPYTNWATDYTYSDDKNFPISWNPKFHNSIHKIPFLNYT